MGSDEQDWSARRSHASFVEQTGKLIAAAHDVPSILAHRQLMLQQEATVRWARDQRLRELRLREIGRSTCKKS